VPLVSDSPVRAEGIGTRAQIPWARALGGHVGASRSQPIRASVVDEATAPVALQPAVCPRPHIASAAALGTEPLLAGKWLRSEVLTTPFFLSQEGKGMQALSKASGILRRVKLAMSDLLFGGTPS